MIVVGMVAAGPDTDRKKQEFLVSGLSKNMIVGVEARTPGEAEHRSRRERY
jgi:hypothetical protein